MEHAAAASFHVVASEDRLSEARRQLEAAYAQVMNAIATLGYPVTTDDNYRETAVRAARAMLDLVHPASDIEDEISEMLRRTFPAKHEGMVLSKHNTCFGMCPHHLLPVAYRISVAYLPRKQVLGISKLSRIVHLLARRPVLQESLTDELAALLHDRLESRGSAILVEGHHTCMAARGIEAHEASVITTAVRGEFLDQPALRREFFDLVSSPRTSVL